MSQVKVGDTLRMLRDRGTYFKAGELYVVNGFCGENPTVTHPKHGRGQLAWATDYEVVTDTFSVSSKDGRVFTVSGPLGSKDFTHCSWDGHVWDQAKRAYKTLKPKDTPKIGLFELASEIGKSMGQVVKIDYKKKNGVQRLGQEVKFTSIKGDQVYFAHVEARRPFVKGDMYVTADMGVATVEGEDQPGSYEIGMRLAPTNTHPKGEYFTVHKDTGTVVWVATDDRDRYALKDLTSPGVRTLHLNQITKFGDKVVQA